jgi:hypothetical protein
MPVQEVAVPGGETGQNRRDLGATRLQSAEVTVRGFSPYSA